MGLFGKKKAVETEETRMLNHLLHIALTFNQETGTWEELPSDVPQDTKDYVIGARKIVFEYIRQLREHQVYSHGATKKFALEQYPWINKQNLEIYFELGQLL